MLRNMVTSLLKHERIHTTDTKAKVLRGWADHLITLARRGDLHARRQALAIVREEAVVHKLFAEAKDRFGSSAGGYTRIIKMGTRPGDAAPMSLIELVAAGGVAAKKPSGKKAPQAKTDAATQGTAPVAAEAAATEPAQAAAPAPVVETEETAAVQTAVPEIQAEPDDKTEDGESRKE